VPVSVTIAEPESELERFEETATRLNETVDTGKRHRHPEKTSSSDDSLADENYDLGNELTSGILDVAIYIVKVSGVYSWQRVTVPPAGSRSEKKHITPRKPGEKTIPYVRIDESYSQINSHINAVGQRVEIGYGPFGYETRVSHYDDSDPSASLDIRQHHFLYRMSFGDDTEMDIGIGEYEISGLSRNSGDSFMLGFSVYPGEHLGIELRPTWANVNGNGISDHELAINYGERFWSLRVGYHWLAAPDSSLDGPFVGFSLRL